MIQHQDLCDHYNLSRAHHQNLTNELELIRRENLDLKVANSELVKLISLSSQASVMQHQNRTLGNNRDVAFERRNNANNVGTERVTLPKSIFVRSTGFVKVNQNVSTNAGGCNGENTNSSWSRVASQLDQLVSESCMQMQQRVFAMCLETDDLKAEVAAGAVSESEIVEVEGACCCAERVTKVKDPYGFVWQLCSPSNKCCANMEA